MNRREQLRRREWGRRDRGRLSKRRESERRGVLLLVVLSMLVLFLLVGTTFLLTSGQYRTASKIVEKANRTTFQPADLLERALMQLVRDTNNADSVIRYHSLLRDLYGVDGFSARVYAETAVLDDDPNGSSGTLINVGPRFAGVDPDTPVDAANNFGRGVTQGQVVELYVLDSQLIDTSNDERTLDERNAVGLDFDEQGLPMEHSLSSVDGYYEGCLLTMLDGPCRGMSVRVVGYDAIYRTIDDGGTAGTTPAATADDRLNVLGRFRILAPQRADGRPLSLGSLLADPAHTVLTDFVDGALGHRFIVNGRPFNGAGVGFNPLALSGSEPTEPLPRLSALEFIVDASSTFAYGMERALIPNPVQYFEPANVFLNPAAGTDPWRHPTGGNYAAADFPALTRRFVPSSDTVNYDESESPLYKTFAGPGDTDESYDAPDTQNMALASQALEPRLRGRVVDATSGEPVDPDAYYPNAAAPAYLDLEGVTIPSFHRPALANFWFHRLYHSSWLQSVVSNGNDRVRAILRPYDDAGAPQYGLSVQDAAQITAIKRKFMMRPLREDHPDFDGSNPLSRYGSSAIATAFAGSGMVNERVAGVDGDDEITFPFWEAVGPWDIDNDGDGVPDSVWVDIGLPVQQTEDGRFYKPLVAMLVEDLDGRLNLNAHGSADDVAFDANDASQNLVGGAFIGNLARDFGAAEQPLYSSDQLAPGTGWGPAEVSLRPILSPTLPLDESIRNSVTEVFTGNPQYDDYARLLYGRPDPESVSRGVPEVLDLAVEFGRYGAAESILTQTVERIQPGRTLIWNNTSAPTVASQAAIEGLRDPRTALEILGAPRFTDSANRQSVPEALSGYTSWAGFRGRYAAGLSAAGAPLAEPVYDANLAIANGESPAGSTWRELAVNTPDDSPYELDLSAEARRLAPVDSAAVERSYTPDPSFPNTIQPGVSPLVDDAPFSPAELERVLRALDADADKLADRLWNVVDGFDPSKLAAATKVNAAIRNPTGDPTVAPAAVTSLEQVVADADAAVNRRLVTTESFDLPTPHENLDDRLLLGADGVPGVPRFQAIGDWVSARFDNGFDDDLDGTIDEADEFPFDDDGDGVTDEGDEVVYPFDTSTTDVTAMSHTFRDHASATSTAQTYDNLFAAGCDDYVVVMLEDPPSPARLTDYLRYRIVLELRRSGVLSAADVFNNRHVVERHVQEILHGSNARPAAFTRTRSTAPLDPNYMSTSPVLFSYGGLLAPEVLAGRRMDLNRPFGDGRDNNGNGVVDEPQEAGEPYTFNPDLTGNSVGSSGELGFSVVNFADRDNDALLYQDVDGDGYLYYDANGDDTVDTFDPGDLAVRDRNGDGAVTDDTAEPIVDNLWIDANRNGLREANEFHPWDYTRGADANGRGAIVNANGVQDDARLARQLFARHLYCLMLALVDDNYLAPYDSEDPQVLHYLDPESGNVPAGTTSIDPDSSEAFRIALDLIEDATPAFPAGTTPNSDVDAATAERRLLFLNRARMIAQRKLTCRMIAQWAINVVDFRDPDAIQTPFEYDENPWDGWNVYDPVTRTAYPIDGDLSTDENLTGFRTIDGAGFSGRLSDSTDYDAIPRKDWTRGIVWGAERPEVILTEGVAWHDRRLEDEVAVDPAPNGTGQADGGLLADSDDDLDQLRKPKGMAFLEAFNPWTGDDQRPAEFYSRINRFNQPPRLNTDHYETAQIEPGIVFERLSNSPEDPQAFVLGDPLRTRSPVWRIACVEEHPLVRNATPPSTTGTPAGFAQDDPPTAGGLPSTPNVPGGSSPTTYYLGHTLGRGPWDYSTDGPDVKAGGVPAALPILGNSYLDFHLAKKQEAIFALLTTIPQATGAGAADADGVAVSLGVIERPPTLPDTSFPSFDRFAQPIDPKTVDVAISSTYDANGSGSVIRGVNTKPTTFIERVFYLAGAEPLQQSKSLGGTSGFPPPGSSQDLAVANVFDPGLRVPLLTYDVPSNYSAAPSRFEEEGRRVGVEKVNASGFDVGRVHASKFVVAYDRTDRDRNGNIDESYESMGVPAFAPLLPGRRVVFGTAGSVYDTVTTVDAADEQYMFDGEVARKITNRYVSVISQSAAATGTAFPPPGSANKRAELRRLEMIPDPDPNVHQFAVRMNGGFESFSVRQSASGDAFNLTGGTASGQQDPTLASAPPVIAIPIDHFSISEPLDEYLLRQVELDPNLNVYPEPNYIGSIPTSTASRTEDYFKQSGSTGAERPFDEPFDILPELVENQTTPNYRSLHIERLANPLLPWNPPPTRPDGQPVVDASGQELHNPLLPVNPYLPVDAHSLDLTAFNSFTDQESLVGSKPNNTQFENSISVGAEGPESRHRRVRDFSATLTAAGGAGAAGSPKTLLGFASNERGRPLGPFTQLWLSEPARLLWRQARGSTFSELAHYLAAWDTHNGYLARTADQLFAPRGTARHLDDDSIQYDRVQLDATPYDGDLIGATQYDTQQYVQVAWRLTLGFADWMHGRPVVGSGLQWLDNINVGGVRQANWQQIDIDGDGIAGVGGSPEVVDPADVLRGQDATDAQPLAVNGESSVVDTTTPIGASNAQSFFETYLKRMAAEQSTTPELAWPNRPLASAGELLQVPVWGGSRMLTYYSVFNWQYTQWPHFTHETQVNPYDGERFVSHDGLDYVGGTLAANFDGDFANDGTQADSTFLDPEELPTNRVRFRDLLGHFGHLMNFFQTARFPSVVHTYPRVDALSGDNEQFVVPRGASHFYRVLDYVCVPSRFTASETLLGAGEFAATGLAGDDPRAELSAPFNRVDRYREPGRINLNTIADRVDNRDGAVENSVEPRDRWSEVYDGLMHRVRDGYLVEDISATTDDDTTDAESGYDFYEDDGDDGSVDSVLKYGHLGPAWRDVALSRRGYVQPGFDPTVAPTYSQDVVAGDQTIFATDQHNRVDYSPRRLHPDFPTLFANPFRAPGEGANVPLAHMVQTGVDATMLRAHPLSPGADGAWGIRGQDERSVNKTRPTTGDILKDRNGLRDDADEAGLLTIQLGGGTAAVPAQPVQSRLTSDVVLAKFQGTENRRGALPDTFLEDAFRPAPDSINPRILPPRQTLDPSDARHEPVPAEVLSREGVVAPTVAVSNSEIGKRATPVALFSGASLEPSLDTERNPTLRYQPIQRLSNLATTRSNVYAVWITIGFFEVKPAREDQRIWPRYMTDTNTDNIGDGGDNGWLGATPEARAVTRDFFFRTYPGGWTLGEELGVATGEDHRHRGFYMVDRSKPVAFKPGEDANVSDTVLLRRRIQ